jgi:hypothetical protein
MSWFFFPGVITIAVIVRYRSEFGSYASWYLAAMYVSALCFVLLPMQPPWMADDSVTRILALHWGSTVHIDDNPVAAMPSLHVALPLTLALWSYAHKHSLLGGVALLFSGLTAMNVVFLGEHYVIDVLGAVAVAAAIYFVATRVPTMSFSRPAWSRGRALSPERGQNLVEFALMSPLLLLLIGAIVVIALGLHTRSNLQQAVREGARQAAVGKSLADVRDLASGNSGGTLSPDDVNWCRPTGSTGSVGDPIRVFIDEDGDGADNFSYTIIPNVGLFGALGISTAVKVEMHPRATARLEKSVSGLPACST